MNQELLEQKLKKALELAPPNVFDKVANLYFVPTFCGEHEFFYKDEHFVGEDKCHKFFLVNMENGEKSDLFDHIILGKRLSDHLGKDINHRKLPIENVKKTADGIEFEYKKVKYAFADNKLTEIEKVPVQKLVISPDGKYGAFTRDENVFIKNMATGEETQITHDGYAHYGYAGVFEGNENIIREKLLGYVRPAGVIWSPDSKKLLTYRIDERDVKELHLIQNVPTDGSMRPIHYAYKYALPEDDVVAMAELYLCDIEKKQNTMVLDKIYIDLSEPFNGGFKVAAWSDEGNNFIAWRMDRGHKNAEVFVINSNTLEKEHIFTETTDTFLFFDFYRGTYGGDPRFDKNAIRQMWYSEEKNRLFWISERDGYYHIYDYDVNGKQVRKQITSGNYNVRQILRIDDENNIIYLTAAGYEEYSSPYKMKAYACDMETGDLKILTPDEHEHYVNLSPDGKYLVDNYSNPDEPPMVIIRDISGKYISTVFEADITPLNAMGISYAMSYKEKGADGKTDIYGIMVFPSDFDPTKKYPIMDYYYGGNQRANTPTNYYDFINKGYLNSLAELGFIVVIVDGHGTPWRSKAFHDACHKNVGSCCGMEDHVAVFKNLCAKYPFMDEDKIAVWGHSGGGFAAYKCMVTYPEVYKCAMASGGNHMQELYISGWSERFMNEYDAEVWKAQNSEFDADKLQGPLLLIHGELDDNVHPAATMRLVDALIKADKDFDFLIFPNKHHLLSVDKYYQKKIFKFFAKHML